MKELHVIFHFFRYIPKYFYISVCINIHHHQWFTTITNYHQYLHFERKGSNTSHKQMCLYIQTENASCVIVKYCGRCTTEELDADVAT